MESNVTIRGELGPVSLPAKVVHLIKSIDDERRRLGHEMDRHEMRHECRHDSNCEIRDAIWMAWMRATWTFEVTEWLVGLRRLEHVSCRAQWETEAAA